MRKYIFKKHLLQEGWLGQIMRSFYLPYVVLSFFLASFVTLFLPPSLAQETGGQLRVLDSNDNLSVTAELASDMQLQQLRQLEMELQFTEEALDKARLDYNNYQNQLESALEDITEIRSERDAALLALNQLRAELSLAADELRLQQEVKARELAEAQLKAESIAAAEAERWRMVQLGGISAAIVLILGLLVFFRKKEDSISEVTKEIPSLEENLVSAMQADLDEEEPATIVGYEVQSQDADLDMATALKSMGRNQEALDLLARIKVSGSSEQQAEAERLISQWQS